MQHISKPLLTVVLAVIAVCVSVACFAQVV